MIELRVVESAADLVTWARIKSSVVPNEPVTPEQLTANAEPERLLLLASLDGVDAGCGIADLSNFGGGRSPPHACSSSTAGAGWARHSCARSPRTGGRSAVRG